MKELMWEMDNHALGARSTTIGRFPSLQLLTHVHSDISVCDARHLFHAVELA